MAGTVLLAISSLSQSITITQRDVCKSHFADEENETKRGYATGTRSHDHGNMKSIFRIRCVWKTMIVLCFEDTMSQRAELRGSFECCIFNGTGRLCVELVDIELNSGCFISSDVIRFIVILMYILNSLNMVPWWVKCQVKSDSFKCSEPPVNGTVSPSSFIVAV